MFFLNTSIMETTVNSKSMLNSFKRIVKTQLLVSGVQIFKQIIKNLIRDWNG